VSGKGLQTAAAGCLCSFRLLARDENGQRMQSGGDAVNAWLGGMDSGPVAANVIDNTDGTYTVTYRPTRPEPGAKLELTVTINGAPLSGSPFRPVLVAGPVSPAHCTASGIGLYDGVAGKENSIIITARDCYGNALTSGGASFSVKITARRPACPEYDAWCSELSEMLTPEDLGDGTYLLKWSQPIAAEYSLHISSERTPIKGSPYVCTLVSPFVQPPYTVSWLPLEPAGSAMSQAPSESSPVAATSVDGQLLVVGKMPPNPDAAFTRPSLHLCQFSQMYEGCIEFNQRDAPRVNDFRYIGRVVQPLPVHRMNVPPKPSLGGFPDTGPHVGSIRAGFRPTSAPVRPARPGSATRPRPFSAMRVAAQRPNSAAPTPLSLPANIAKPPAPVAPLATLGSTACTGSVFLLYACRDDVAIEPSELGACVETSKRGLRLGVSRIEIRGGCQAQLPNLTSLLKPLGRIAPAARIGSCYAVARLLSPGLGQKPEGGASSAGEGTLHANGASLDVMIDEEGPAPDQDNNRAADGEAVWVFGGEGPDGMTDELWCFNSASLVWNQIHCEDGPSARSHAAMAVDEDGRLWLLGGRTAAGVSEEVFCFEPRARRWSKPKISGYPPAPRFGHSLTPMLGRFMLACGGTDERGRAAREVAFLDLTELRWHLRSASPPVNATTANGAAYVCGRHLLLGEVEVGATNQTDRAGGTAATLMGAKTSGMLYRVAPIALSSGAFTQHGCIRFTGDACYAATKLPVTVGTSIGVGGFSLEAWVMPTESPSGSFPAMVACKGDASSRASFGLAVTGVSSNGGVAGAQIGLFVGGAAKVQVTAHVPLRKWTHLIGTFEGQTGSLALYCNGKLVDSGASTVAARDIAGRGETDFFFGGAPGKPSFVGCLDFVALWNRRLTLDEVRRAEEEQLPERGRGTGLLGLWTLNEGSGDVCYDTHLPAAGRKGVSILDATIVGKAEREASSRQHTEPELIQSERYLHDKAEELAAWRRRFAEKHLRPASKADLLMAESDVLHLAKLLGEL